MLKMLESMRERMVLSSSEAMELGVLSPGALLLDGKGVYWIKGQDRLWFSNTGSEGVPALVIFETTGIEWYTHKPSVEEDDSLQVERDQ